MSNTTDVAVWNLLRTARIPYSTEKEMQDAIEQFLTQHGVQFEREFAFSKKDRVDFLAGSIAIECKVKGQPMAVYRQVERYCAYERVLAVILFTAFHMDLPHYINGKMALVIKPGKAWL